MTFSGLLQIFAVACANFSNLPGKLLKTQNRYGHHVFAKSCARSSAQGSLEKIFKKFGFMGFFEKKSFEKTLFLTVCNLQFPIYQNILAFKRCQKFFHTWFFWTEKRWKNYRKFFLIRCSKF